MNAIEFTATELLSLKDSLRLGDAKSVIEKIGAWELVKMSLQESDEQFYKGLNSFIPLLDQAEVSQLQRMIHWHLENHSIRNYLIEIEIKNIIMRPITIFVK